MQTTQPSSAVPAVRPPRAMAWLLLLASAAAVLLTGLATTLLVLKPIEGVRPHAIGGVAVGMLLAGCLTIGSLGLRSLRWIFFLRRASTRLPIRDAYIGYLSGLSLLFAPFLLGEIAVRAYVNKGRGSVPVLTTAVVNVWERLLDLVALCAIAGVLSAIGSTGAEPRLFGFLLLAACALTLVPDVRRIALSAIVAVCRPIAERFDSAPAPGAYDELTDSATWVAALPVSIAAWLLAGLGLRAIAAVWSPGLDSARAESFFALSTLAGALKLAPAGVVVSGARLLTELQEFGLSPSDAVITVFAVRMATVGLSTIVGVFFLAVHFRSQPAVREHFDELASAYDVQIPEPRRLALLAKKTGMMREVLDRRGAGRVGLDIGCGQGWYLARMREMGFDVSGIDASPGQIALAERHVGREGLVRTGSALEIPAPDGCFDFAYVINVLHHLPSVDDQRRAFEEILRVLKPGGLLFVHEINTRNILFRFYMGYVFPSINCIDEGIERWLLPDRLDGYTGAPVVETRYFTFLPEFVPQALADALGPFERALERSRLGVYSAHYMAVIQKPPAS